MRATASSTTDSWPVLSNSYFLYYAALLLGLAGVYEVVVQRPPWKRMAFHVAAGAAAVAAVFFWIGRAYSARD